MTWFVVARAALVVVVGYSAYVFQPLPGGGAVNVVFGGLLGAAVMALELRLVRIAMPHLLGAVVGATLGLGAARTIGAALYWLDPGDSRVAFLHAVLLLSLPYLGLVLGARRGEWLDPRRIAAMFAPAPARKSHKVLDTSVIIDGRVADICDTGFLDGSLVVPQFVLRELQAVADSPDAARRNRGRRGLDILQKIQKMSGVDVSVSDVDFPDVHDVDLKLIELARSLSARIVTNDFNLNKVAQLRGVEVLNINELANALKPVVLPGERMSVLILKEGKEYNQGVAYLDDGTMVVVEEGRRHMNTTIEVTVTKVLQTAAGRMIFARPGVHPDSGGMRNHVQN